MYILFLQFTHTTAVRFFTTLFECKGNLIQPKTERDLNEFYIIKLDYSSCTQGSENSSSEFTKRVVRNCPTENVDNQKYQVTLFPILNTELSLSARYFFFILSGINVYLNSWEKNLEKPSAN